MKVNQINGYKINFTSNNQQIAPRSQQQNSVNFEKEQNLARKADSMSANPLTSLGYKLYRTFRIFAEPEQATVSTQPALNVVA